MSWVHALNRYVDKNNLGSPKRVPKNKKSNAYMNAQKQELLQKIYYHSKRGN